MKAKKSLGQHFLTSQGALRAIIDASDLKPTDTVLEIGPGKGILTTELLKHAGQVVAIEKDRELFLWLQIQFANEIRNKKLILLNEDILDFEPKGDYKVVANIPYNITGAIMEKFLSAKPQPSSMTLLVQKEVAERIVARSTSSGQAKEGKESILSLSVKVYGEPKYIQTVKAGSFNPPPKVDSAILQISNISRNKFNPPAGGAKVTEANFFKIVKAGFAHKRKTISNNLKELKVNNEKLDTCGVKSIDRAEDLTLDQWLCLTKNI